MLGCYRKGEAEDAEIYVRALAAVLTGYPEAVVNRVADPRTGIAGRSQFLPTIAEARHACEAEMKPIRAAEERRAREADRLALPAPDDRSQRKTYAELVEQYPDILAQSGPRRNIAPSPAAIATLEAGLIDKYANRPVTLSPAALAAMGIGANETEDAA